MLLRTVVQISLEPAAFGILGRDDPLAGGTQLGRLGRDLFQSRLQFDGQPNAIERCAGLRGQIGQQSLLGGRERRAGWLAHGDLAHQYALVEHG